MLRSLRALRLLKLARLLRASRIFKRWETQFAINYTILELTKCVLTLLVCVVAPWSVPPRDASKTLPRTARARPSCIAKPIVKIIFYFNAF